MSAGPSVAPKSGFVLPDKSSISKCEMGRQRSSAKEVNNSAHHLANRQRSQLWSPEGGDSKSFAVLADCPSHLKTILQEVEFLGPNDPAFFVVYADDASIHAALAIAGSPVAQASDAASSATNFRNFVAGRFRKVDANRIGIQVGGAWSSEVFHRLSDQEACDITNWSVTNCVAWSAAVAAAGCSTGKLYRMYQITPEAGGAAGSGLSPQAHGYKGVLFLIH